MTQHQNRWSRLRPELLRRQRANQPIETTIRRVRNAIIEVGDDYVVLLSEQGKKPRRILAQEINTGDIEQYIGRRRIIKALRETADSLP